LLLFFADVNLGNIAAVRLDSSISFDWGSGAPSGVGNAFPSDNFSVRWKGTLTAKFTGNIPFHLFSSLLFSSLLFSILLFSSLFFSSLLFASLHFSSLLFSSLHFSSLLFTSLHFSSLLFTSLHFSSLLFTSLHLSSLLSPL
jgi:hypothetical protein